MTFRQKFIALAKQAPGWKRRDYMTHLLAGEGVRTVGYALIEEYEREGVAIYVRSKPGVFTMGELGRGVTREGRGEIDLLIYGISGTHPHQRNRDKEAVRMLDMMVMDHELRGQAEGEL